MTRKDILKILNDFEREFSVENWEIGGIKVWPLIKIDIFFRHIKSEESDLALKGTKKKSNSNKWGRVLSIFSSFIQYTLFLLRPKRTISIFLSDSEGHRVMHGGKFINRYFQPIFEHIEETHYDFREYLTISDDTNYARYPSTENIVFVQKLLSAVRVLNLISLKRKTAKNSMHNFEAFLSVFQKEELSYLNINSQYKYHVRKRVEAILVNGIIMKKLMRKHQPKIIFELCYYSTVRFSINHLAHKYSINSVEIQHGGMGNEHICYSNWLKIPKEGYSILPKTLWTWDNGSYNLIEKWVEKQSFHNVIRGGNPWLSYATQSNSLFSFPHDEKIILYTLQYSEIPPIILKMISLTPEGFTWWIRLHPRKIESKPFIQNELIKAGVNMDHIEIEKATTYPLPQLLSNSYLHISGSSGSVIEAAELGIISLILDPIGLVYYNEILKMDLAVSMVNKSENELFNAIFVSAPHKQGTGRAYEDVSYKKVVDKLLNEA